MSFTDRRTNPLKSAVKPRFCRSACPLYDDRVEGCQQVGKASGDTHLCAWTVAEIKRHGGMKREVA